MSEKKEKSAAELLREKLNQKNVYYMNPAFDK